jgi:hypothetical protein
MFGRKKRFRQGSTLIRLYFHRSLPPLELELLPPSLVRFRPSALQYIGGKPTSKSLAHHKSNNKNSSQIQRLGEILCHDRVLAAAMLLPQQSLLALLDHHQARCCPPALPSTHLDLVSDPASILFIMDDSVTSATHQAHATAFLRAFLERTPDPPQHRLAVYDPPVSLLAWKIDTPVRILAYTGPPQITPLTQAQLAQPHTITPKTLLNERSGRPTPARIHLFLPSTRTIQPPPPGDIVRASLANYPIVPYRETLAGNMKGVQTRLTSHALEEAVSSFIQPPPPANTTTAQLHQTMPQWTHNYMDCR